MSVCPLCHNGGMTDLLDPFDPPGVAWQRVEQRLATVRLIGLAIWCVPLTLAGVVVALVSPHWWSIAWPVAAAALGVWIAWLIPRQVRAMAYAVRDRDLYLRRGIMFRNLTVLPYVRIQMVDVRVGPIERSFNLAGLTVSTASPTLTASLSGITPETAAALRELLTDRDRLTGVRATPTPGLADTDGPTLPSADGPTPPPDPSQP